MLLSWITDNYWQISIPNLKLLLENWRGNKRRLEKINIPCCTLGVQSVPPFLISPTQLFWYNPHPLHCWHLIGWCHHNPPMTQCKLLTRDGYLVLRLIFCTLTWIIVFIFQLVTKNYNKDSNILILAGYIIFF